MDMSENGKYLYKPLIETRDLCNLVLVGVQGIVVMAFKNKEAFYGRLNCNRNMFIHICEMLLLVIIDMIELNEIFAITGEKSEKSAVKLFTTFLHL